MKKYLSLVFLLLVISCTEKTQADLPFLANKINADDAVALLLNKYYEQEKTFNQAVKALQEKKFDFDKNFEEFHDNHKKLSEYEAIVAFFKSLKIDVPLHLLGTYSYNWVLHNIFDRQKISPHDFNTYKKYVPVLSTILKKTADYIGPFKNGNTPQSLLFQIEFEKGYFEQIDKLYKGEIKLPLFKDKQVTINRPLSEFKGSRLVLGCSHGLKPTPGIPSCPHVNKQRYDQDYTLNMTGEPDINDKLTDITGNYRNPELWEKLPADHFESVLFEYTPGIMEPRLLKEIFRVLKPGGYVGSSAPIPDVDKKIDLIGELWTQLAGKPLGTETYRQVFESAGFENAGTGMVDGYVKTDYEPYQKIGVYAFKPKIK